METINRMLTMEGVRKEILQTVEVSVVRMNGTAEAFFNGGSGSS